MKRGEFMTRLSALLQDLPADERREALQYYEDYFRDAGEENEAEVIETLGSPEKVADTIREGLGVSGTRAKTEERERVPAAQEVKTSQGELNKDNNRILKILLIVAICVVASPVIGGALLTVLGLMLTVAGIFLGVIVGGVSMVIVGVVLFFSGIVCLLTKLALGLALMGSGLICMALGGMMAVASVWLSAKAVKLARMGWDRFFRWFHRREAAF